MSKKPSKPIERNVVTLDPEHGHKFLSDWCFSELTSLAQDVHAAANAHAGCPPDHICDCPHHRNEGAQ